MATRNKPIGFLSQKQEAWIGDRYKLYSKNGKNFQLYDLTKDHAEKTDLSNQFPEVKERMMDELNAWKKTVMVDMDQCEPYGLSYRMMFELQEEFPEDYPRIIHFVAENGKGANKLRIDIDAWLETLPTDRRTVAHEIIGNYAKVLHRKVSEQYYFTIPAIPAIQP